jgi:hypothetical protein
LRSGSTSLRLWDRRGQTRYEPVNRDTHTHTHRHTHTHTHTFLDVCIVHAIHTRTYTRTTHEYVLRAQPICVCVCVCVCVPTVPQAILAAEQRNKVVSKLHAILRPFMLRRLKSDVDIELPRKSEMILYAPMTDTQKKMNTQLKDGTLKVRRTDPVTNHAHTTILLILAHHTHVVPVCDPEHYGWSVGVCVCVCVCTGRYGSDGRT